MRTFRSLAMAVTALALAAGCEPTPPREAAQRQLVRPALGFALNVPAGWTWRDLSGDVVLEIYRQPRPESPDAPADTVAADRRIEKRPLAVLQMTVIDREDVTLDAWADQTVQESRQWQEDLEETGRTRTTLADGREALVLTLRNPRGLEPVVQRLLLTLTGRRAFALTATAPASQWPSLEADVKTCTDSLVVW